MHDRALLMDFYALTRDEFDALTLEEFQAMVTHRNQSLGPAGPAEGGGL